MEAMQEQLNAVSWVLVDDVAQEPEADEEEEENGESGESNDVTVNPSVMNTFFERISGEVKNGITQGLQASREEVASNGIDYIHTECLRVRCSFCAPS